MKKEDEKPPSRQEMAENNAGKHDNRHNKSTTKLLYWLSVRYRSVLAVSGRYGAVHSAWISR